MTNENVRDDDYLREEREYDQKNIVFDKSINIVLHVEMPVKLMCDGWLSWMINEPANDP